MKTKGQPQASLCSPSGAVLPLNRPLHSQRSFLHLKESAAYLRQRLLACLIALAFLMPAYAGKSADESTEAEPPSARALLYRVTDSEDKELWLLGSIHLADRSIYPLPENVETAWSKSQVLAVEADISRVDGATLQQQMMRSAMDPAGRTLSDRLPKDLYSETKARLEKIGMDIRLFESMRPWFIAMMISTMAIQEAGLKPEYGIEHHFLSRAGDREVVELEGVASQLAIFSGLSDDLEVLFLRHALVDTENLGDAVRKLLETWRTGDEAGLLSIRQSISEEHPELAPIDEILFAQRNRKMTATIAEYLESSRPHFVVVGAAHLVGEDSIVNMLQRRGLNVERN